MRYFPHIVRLLPWHERKLAPKGTMSVDNSTETPLISPHIVTLIPYGVARRLCALAVTATPNEVTVLMSNPDDREAVTEMEQVAGRSVIPLPAPREEIKSWIDHLSGSLNTDDLWLQQRHIAALGRLVDHAVNIGQIETVRPLVDRALEFAPYSAEMWLLKARLSVQRKDVVDALTIASQIAPNDRRVLRWIHSMQDLDDESRGPSPAPKAAHPPVDASPASALGISQRDSSPRSAPPEPRRFEMVPDPVDEADETAVADASFQAARELSVIRDLDQLMERTALALRAISRADSVSVYFKIPPLAGSRSMNTPGWSGWSTSSMLQSHMAMALPKENRLAAQVVRQGIPIVITDTSSRLEDVGTLVLETGVGSFALLPVRVGGTVGGLVYLNYSIPEQANHIFDPELARGIELVLNCAGNAAGAVEFDHGHTESASIDGLTDSYTLDQFERLLTAEVERARRYRFSVSVMSLDVDDFSSVNGSRGRAFGDGLLREIATEIRTLQRASDVLARRGDDEFVVMLPQTTAKGAANVARRLVRALSSGVYVNGTQVPLSVSIGIATFPDQANDGASLLTAVEMALYTAKAEAGRGDEIPRGVGSGT
jgi:diguanylate cyclase (GGDEF)-like protein